MPRRARGGSLATLLLIVACAAPTATTTPPPGSGPVPTPSTSASGETEKPSSQALIASDLEAGTIDLATSLELRAWALFGDARLPEAYDGAGSAGEDQALFNEIAANLDSLPPAKRDVLSAYLLRPTDPRSPFSAPPPAAASGVRLAAFTGQATPPPTECTLPRKWFNADWSPDGSANEGFRVWSCGLTQAIVQDVLDRVIAVGSALWAKMTVVEPNGMGRPVPDTGSAHSDGNGKTDIYLVDALAECRQRGDACQVIPGDGVAAGPKDFPEYCSVNGYPARGCSGFLLLGKDRLADPAFAADFAHEFFHVLQHAHNGKIDISWYHEASAVWAEWHYERAASKTDSYIHFSNYQLENRSLLWYEYESVYQYQAWGWPLFQAMTAGPANVFQTWSAIEASITRTDVDDAIDSKLEFATSFRDFAVRNAQPEPYLPPASTGLEDDSWRTKPELADFPADAHVVSAARSEIKLGKFPHSVDIQPLAAQYDEYEVLDDNIAQIEIDISQLSNAGQADLDAIGQLHGADTWRRFRASAGILKLCRLKAEQNVTYMEFVISNHLVARDGDLPDMAKRVTGEYTIEAKDSCEEQDVLLHGTFTGHHEGVLDTTDASFELDIVWHRPVDVHDTLNFELVAGSFTFSTSVAGVCAGSLSEGGKLEQAGTNTQLFSYGDPTEGSRYASAGVFDQRLDYGRILIGLDAHFDVPHGSAECQPPFQPFGEIGGCPLLFAVTDDRLEPSATCEDSVGTTWTGHISGQP